MSRSNRVFLRLFPSNVTKAAVIQRIFDQLIAYSEIETTWAAIPYLWQLVTTINDNGKVVRISVGEALRRKHELHAISTLLALYAQTPFSDRKFQPDATWRFDGLLVREPAPKDDELLKAWFHGPYLDEKQ